MCSTFEGPPRERKLQQLNSSGGRAKEDPNTNERELLRDPKDRNELQKEVFAALFSVPENSDEDGVEVQSIKKGDNDEEDSLQALRRAVMEYRGTMKEHCKAVVPRQVIDAFTQGDHVRAGKLLEQARFPSTAIY
ncbi:hypothetical protein CUMW_162730 [Citrus unshiu]|nr:hypothetical protein CUMW_162730 [Citrus unshiu]